MTAPSDDADISPTPEPLADEPHQRRAGGPAAGRASRSSAGAEEPAAQEEPPAPPKRKSRGRASVPSWDEIMFGGKSD